MLRFLKLVNGDLYEGVVFLILASILFSISARMPNFGTSVLSPGLFPAFASGFLGFLGLVIAVQGLLKTSQRLKDQDTKEESSPSPRVDWLSVATTVGLSLFYLLLLPRVHFLPATIIFMILFLWQIGERRWWMVILLAVGTTGLLYLVFGTLLKVLLP